MTYDIIIKNAKLRNCDTLMSIAVQSGKIAAIEKNLSAEAKQVIDAKGGLTTESFVNGHLHLDKVYTLRMAGEAALTAYNGEGMGGAMTSIERAADFKSAYDESWIIPNVRKACDLAVKYGNTHIRAFADVDSKARLEGIKALLKAREEYKGKVALQVVAFPQDGVVREPEAEGYVLKSLEMGADVVGGIPWIEFTKADEQAHVDRMFDLAVKHDRTSPCCSTTWATGRSGRSKCSASERSRWAGRGA